MTPKISVIVPVYKVEERLPYCLNSIINQTFTDFEVICVNDGSPDNSLDILNRYAEKDSRFKVISQENQGLGPARNTGLNHATGEYICYLDSDDYIHPQCLEILYHFAKKNNADLVNGRFERVMGYDYQYSNIDKNNITCFTHTNPVMLGCRPSRTNITYNVWGKLFRRNFVSDIKFTKNGIIEDGVYMYEVLTKKPKTVVVEAILNFYVINPTSITHSSIKPNQMRDYCKAIWEVIDMYKKEELKEEYDVILTSFIPAILKQQKGHCRRAPKEFRKEMYDIFRAELKELHKKGFLQRRGHKLRRYIIYKLLLWNIM